MPEIISRKCRCCTAFFEFTYRGGPRPEFCSRKCYRASNKDQINQKAREWLQNNKEKRRKKTKERYHKNPSKWIAQNRVYVLKKRGIFIRECAICSQEFSVVGKPRKMTCGRKCSYELQLARASIYQKANYQRLAEWRKDYFAKNRGVFNARRMLSYFQGPSNPKDETQWLRKNQAQLRNLRRYLRSRRREQLESSQPVT